MSGWATTARISATRAGRSPSISACSTGQADVDGDRGDATVGSLLAADLAVEQKKLDDAVGKYGQFWPVATLALKFRF